MDWLQKIERCLSLAPILWGPSQFHILFISQLFLCPYTIKLLLGETKDKMERESKGPLIMCWVAVSGLYPRSPKWISLFTPKQTLQINKKGTLKMYTLFVRNKKNIYA